MFTFSAFAINSMAINLIIKNQRFLIVKCEKMFTFSAFAINIFDKSKILIVK
jgi:hypothetical protein